MRLVHIITTAALLSLLFAGSGCGGDEAGQSDAGLSSDAGADASADAGAQATCTCVAVGADYTNGVGVFSALHVPSLTVEQDLLPGAVYGDPVVRYLGGRIYVTNRYGQDANVTVIDPEDFAVLTQFSPGVSYGPSDTAVSADRATGWVVGLAPRAQTWNLADPGTAPTAETDLASLDSDGNPDAASIALVGDRLYVTLSLLDDNWNAAAHGKVAVLDAATGTLVTSFDLATSNPFGFLRPYGDELLTANVADFSGTSGCVERIRPGDAPGTEGCLVENSAVGGYVSGIAGEEADGKLYLAVAGMDGEGNPVGKLVRWTAATGAVETLTPAEQVVTDVARCPATGHLVYTDSAVGGLRVLDPATGTELTSAPLDIGLPPAYAGALACY